MVSEGEVLGELLDIALDRPVPAREGAFYRVQLPPSGTWSRWFTPEEPCPFDYVLAVQLHNIDSYDDPLYARIMGQFKVGRDGES